MDELRSIEEISLFPLKFQIPSRDKYPAITTIREPNGGKKLTKISLNRSLLRQFFKESTEKHDLRLVFIPVTVDALRVIQCDRLIFREVLHQIGPNPWIADLIRTQQFGFHYSSFPSDGGPASYFLGTSFARTVWTITRHNESGLCMVNCLMLTPSDRFDDYVAVSPPLIEPAKVFSFIRTMTSLQTEYHCSMFLPFVLAAHTLSWANDDLLHSLEVIRHIESRTGHGSYGTDFKESRTTIPVLTAKLGLTKNVIINVSRHASIIKSLLDFILGIRGEASAARPHHTDAVDSINPRILSAAKILRRRASSTEKQCQYLRGRAETQASVLFSFLTHEDAKTNIEIAHASRDLAKAMQRDGSSMKTIAVLTMLFLPATFLAALFSMPCLGWDQPDKLKLYWACVIPITLVTFAVWATATQMEQLSTNFGWLYLR